jgi:hypothetical protein
MTTLFIPDFITADEAADLLRLHHFNNDPATSAWVDHDIGGVVVPKSVREGLLKHPVVQRAYEFVKENYSPKLSLSLPSYVSTEDMPNGHQLHDDRGVSYNKGIASVNDGGHMKWCRHSASVLLSPASEFTGGEFYYGSIDIPHVSPHDQYLGLSYHSSDEKHGVTPHDGKRVMLLLFMGEEGCP